MLGSMKVRAPWWLSMVLVGCSKPAAPPEARPTGGGECPQNHCEPRPASAPRAAASGFAECAASVEVPWASQPNLRPFSAELTRQHRAQGQDGVCCYEAQRLCGGGRPLRVGGQGRLASLRAGHWG